MKQKSPNEMLNFDRGIMKSYSVESMVRIGLNRVFAGCIRPLPRENKEVVDRFYVVLSRL